MSKSCVWLNNMKSIRGHAKSIIVVYVVLSLFNFSMQVGGFLGDYGLQVCTSLKMSQPVHAKKTVLFETQEDLYFSLKYLHSFVLVRVGFSHNE